MQKTIKAMETKYLQPSLEMIEDVFTKWDSPEEGKVVRSLVEEIRSKKYYLPELELIMVNEDDLILGYAAKPAAAPAPRKANYIYKVYAFKAVRKDGTCLLSRS